MHGGTSTGPRTLDGLERCRRANWKHGRYSAAAMEQERQLRRMLRQMRGKLEIAQQMAGHESARTTGLYDRRNDTVALAGVAIVSFL